MLTKRQISIIIRTRQKKKGATNTQMIKKLKGMWSSEDGLLKEIVFSLLFWGTLVSGMYLIFYILGTYGAN